MTVVVLVLHVSYNGTKSTMQGLSYLMLENRTVSELFILCVLQVCADADYHEYADKQTEARCAMSGITPVTPAVL